MVHSLQYGRNVISSVHLAMQQNKVTIKRLLGSNLRRLRTARNLTQDQLGGMLDPAVDGSHIAGIEAGNGVSDEVLARLCNALKVEPWEFSWTERMPIVKDAQEREYLDMIRQAQAAGVAEEITRYGKYMLSTTGGGKKDGDALSHQSVRSGTGKKPGMAGNKRRAG